MISPAPWLFHIRVPAGVCVTTDAYQRIMAEGPSIDERLDRLTRLQRR